MIIPSTIMRNPSYLLERGPPDPELATGTTEEDGEGEENNLLELSFLGA